jgi:hypothetical protein
MRAVIRSATFRPRANKAAPQKAAPNKIPADILG